MALLLAALLMIPGLVLGPSIDAAVFLTVGRELAEGATPYAGAWDHKPPAVHLVAFLARAVGPDGQWPIVWALSVGATGLLASALFAGMVRVSRPRVAAVVAVFASSVTAIYAFSLGGGLAETFAAPLAVSALLASTQGRRPTSWLLSGALVGVATAFSVLAVATLPAIVVAQYAKPRSAWMSLPLTLLGMATTIGSTAALLGLTGGLAAAFDAVVTFNRAYVAGGGVEPLLGSAATRFIGAMLPLVVLAGGAAIGWPRVPSDARPYFAAAAAWLTTAGVLVASGRQVYGHYLVMAVPPLAMLAVLGMVVQRPALPSQRILAWAMGLLTMGVAGALLFTLSAEESAVTRGVATAARSAASIAAERTGPDDRILVWGNAAVVYLDADRRPSSPHFYLAPLITRGYTTTQLIRDEASRMCEAPPAIIVDAGSLQPGAPGMPALLEPRPTLQAQRRNDLLGPLRAVVAEHYRLISAERGFLIYQLTTEARPLSGESCAVH